MDKSSIFSILLGCPFILSGRKQMATRFQLATLAIFVVFLVSCGGSQGPVDDVDNKPGEYTFNYEDTDPW